MKSCDAARNSLPVVIPAERISSLGTWGGMWLGPTARGRTGGTGLAASIAMMRSPLPRGDSVLLLGQVDDQAVQLDCHGDLAPQACVWLESVIRGNEQIPLGVRSRAADPRRPLFI